MKSFAKIALIAAAATLSAGAFAQATCATTSGDQAAAAAGGKVTYAAPAAGSTCYMQTAFESPLSANVGLKWVQTTTASAVATSNTKGRNQYTGSSEGGRVSACGAPTTGTDAPGLDAPDTTKPNGCNR